MNTKQFVFFLINATEKGEISWRQEPRYQYKEYVCKVRLGGKKMIVTICPVPYTTIQVEKDGKNGETTYRAEELCKLVESIENSNEKNWGLDRLLRDL